MKSDLQKIFKTLLDSAEPEKELKKVTKAQLFDLVKEIDLDAQNEATAFQSELNDAHEKIEDLKTTIESVNANEALVEERDKTIFELNTVIYKLKSRVNAFRLAWFVTMVLLVIAIVA